MIWGQTSPPYSLARLNRALADAGAPALNSTEEQQLTALITTARSSRQDRQPSAEVQAARTAYDNALLAGDTNAAVAQAAVIANATTADLRTRLETDANFVVEALNILKTNGDQIGALQKERRQCRGAEAGRLARGRRFQEEAPEVSGAARDPAAR